ncbi:MAG: site-specific integrase, partial [Bacteroidetes bacterium]|nr:site-specific integrase [Bacteroidota bacterium]
MGEHIRFLREDGKEITPKAVKNSFLGLEEEKRTILQIFEEHNENIKKLINIDFSPETYQKYEACRRHLKEYIIKKYKQDDMEVSQINYEFITYFETFLKTTKKNNHNTALKFIGNFKKIVRIAMANGWLKQDPFLNYKMSLKKVDRGFLTDDELQA